MRGRNGRRAFSLLEVMVAIAVLGLSLTVILSAQGGLAASNQRAANMGNAVNLGRCKMTEIEEKLLKLGYPEIDDLQDRVSCCNDDSGKFQCDTRVEKVVLPNPPSNSLGDGGAGLGLGGPAGSSSAGSPLGGLLGGGSAAQLNLDGGVQGLTSQLGAAGGGAGAEGLINMVMGMVYPAVKPMLEMSIRRVSVTVKWKEGPVEREVLLVQYLTNPQRAGFVNGLTDGLVPPGSSAAPVGTAAPGTGGASPAGAGGLGGAGAGGRPGGP